MSNNRLDHKAAGKGSRLRGNFSILWLFGLLIYLIFLPACVDKTPYLQGQILYENFCANCHMEDGTGLVGVIPPLAGSDYLVKYSETLACMIREGASGEMIVNGKTYNTVMPGVPQLTEFEITNVINYINTAWGNNNPVTKHLDVRSALAKCE